MFLKFYFFLKLYFILFNILTLPFINKKEIFLFIFLFMDKNKKFKIAAIHLDMGIGGAE
jgi:hypothetical protein